MFEEQLNRTRISLKSQPRYIYALIDPRDDTVRYVGMTNNLYSRLREHVKRPPKMSDRGEWIAELRQLDLYPEMEILETIESKLDETALDTDIIALEREKYWIHKFLESGIPLLNIVGNQQDFNPSTPFGEARMCARLTINQLSIESNVSQWIIRRIERDVPVSAPLAARVCKVLSRYLNRSITYRDLGIKVVESQKRRL